MLNMFKHNLSLTNTLPPPQWCHDKGYIINHYCKRRKILENNNFPQDKNDGLTGIRIHTVFFFSWHTWKFYWTKSDFPTFFLWLLLHHLLSTNVNSVEKKHSTSFDRLLFMHGPRPFLNTQICGTIKYLEHLLETFPDNNLIILIDRPLTEPINLWFDMKRFDRWFNLPSAPLTWSVQRQ